MTPARELLDRARAMIPPADRRVLLSPPRLVARFARFALLRHAGQPAALGADDIRKRDTALVGIFHDFFERYMSRLFRVHIEGVENVPAHGAALLVGNHNGGLVPIDSFFTAMAVHGHFGLQRAVYSMVHDFIFEDPLLRHYALALGMLRAGEESARHAFAQGHLVLVYPGSDIETFRTFRDRGKVTLGGRKGFLRLALHEQVPIVPVVSAGTHEQFIVLTRGDRLARWLHAHRWARTDVAPLVLAFPWGLTTGFVPYLPLPAQTSIAFGKPIAWPELSPRDAERPEVLERCYRQVEQHMQSMLDRLMEGRRFFWGKRHDPS